MTALSPAERRNWLRLSRTQNVGPVTFAALITRFGSATGALDAVPRLARQGGTATLKIPTVSEADRELDALAALGGRFICSCEPAFPAGLAALEPPPPLIAVLGQASILQREMVAIVGARNASALGRRFAATLASDLGQAGLVIASGMARGIDAAAHAAALPTGTCAVLAGGVDIIYPTENTALYEQLRAEGVLISEMPMHESPQARHFPRRNRIISGVSRGTIIVEAAENSGSLITANYALEQGREVFSVPGSPLDPRARGTNRLIRQGATLTESTEDVLDVLRTMLGREFAEPPPPHSPSSFSSETEGETERVRERLLELLAPSAVEVDELIRQCRESSAVVMAALLELELAGRAKRHPGNRASLA